jgi:hypothetical protein
VIGVDAHPAGVAGMASVAGMAGVAGMVGMGGVKEVASETSEGMEGGETCDDECAASEGDADMRPGDDGGDGSKSRLSKSELQSNCINVMAFADSDSASDSVMVSPEMSKSDISEGRGEEDRISAGNEVGACMEDKKVFAGAKSSSVNMKGLSGKMPVQAKADAKRDGVIDTACTFMYSGTTL